MTPTIHVVDDDESFLRSMERRLRSHGYTVATYPSVARFFKRPDPEKPGCVLADLQMPMRDGFEDFLTKRAATADLVAAIDRAIGRNARERTQRLRCDEARKKVALLSDRELQMLLGIVKGITNREMAEEYGLSERTVKYHRTMLTRRLDIYASVDLTRLVQDAGITIEELARMASAGKPVRGRSK